MHQVRVRYNLGPSVVYAEALEGTVVEITSPGDIVAPGHGAGRVDGYHAGKSAVVLAGYVHSTLTLRSPAGVSPPRIATSAGAGEGGVVLMAMGDGYPGIDSHVFLGGVLGKKYSPPNCANAHRLGYMGFPDPGYRCEQSVYGSSVLVCDGGRRGLGIGVPL